MKTTNDILTDIWKIVVASPINDLNGGVYKSIRPTDSVLEDCIISLIKGGNTKFLQDGAFSVKIFYNDIFANNTYQEDTLKGSAMEVLLWNLSETLLNTEGYSFEIQSRELYTTPVNEINQHFAILKMNFQLTY